MPTVVINVLSPFSSDMKWRQSFVPSVDLAAPILHSFAVIAYQLEEIGPADLMLSINFSALLNHHLDHDLLSHHFEMNTKQHVKSMMATIGQQCQTKHKTFIKWPLCAINIQSCSTN